MSGYGAFKCQYSCQADPDCHSFFGRFGTFPDPVRDQPQAPMDRPCIDPKLILPAVDLGKSTEHFSCTGYTEL
jgi:hypothetical protein